MATVLIIIVITAIYMIEFFDHRRTRRQRDEAEALLLWLNSRGGLGLDVHDRIDKVLGGKVKP